MFNLTTQSWSLVTKTVKMPVHRSGCAVLPNEEILIVGNWDAPYNRSAFTFNVRTSVYTSLPNTTYDQVLCLEA